jgi:hypothetical protein
MLVGCGDNFGQDDLTVDGRYYLESSFKTPRGLPESVDSDLDSFLDLSGRPDRVSAWVLEMVEDELDGTARDVFRYARSGTDADAEFQKFLEENSPELVASLTELASSVEDVTTSINLLSELELKTDPEDVLGLTGTAEHRLTGVIYRVGDQEYRYDFSELGLSAPATMTTDFIIHDKKDGYERVISFGQQDMNLQYGQMLDYAINNVVTEKVDPFADSFTDLVTDLVPCHDAGKWVADELDFGNAEIYGAACAAAIDNLGRRLLPLEMEDIDVQVDFTGDAVVVEDNDADDRMDGLTNGQWEGTLAYPGLTINLRRPDHTFFGNRSRARDNNDDVGR